MPNLAGLSLYVRSRHPVGLLVGLIVVSACESLFGTKAMQLPAATGAGTVTIPFRYELPIVAASLVVGSLHAGMDALEESGSWPLRQAQVGHVIGWFGFTVTLGLVAGVVTGPTGDVVVPLRGFVGWIGLALMAGRLLGWRLCWTLPIVTVFPLIYFGYDDGGSPRWWNWATPTSQNAVAWLVALGFLGAGMASMASTPWRLAVIRRNTWARPSRARDTPSRPQ